MKESNKDLLIYLLEGILKVKIKEVEYLNLERNVDNIYVKRKHFDLNLKTDVGRIQVEVNTSTDEYVNPRNMAYLCDIYSHYTLKGEEYSEDVNIIQINFSYHLKDKKDLRIYYYQDQEGKRYINNLKTYEINMEKYKNYWYTKDVQKIEDNKEIIMLDLEPKELSNLSKSDRMVEKYMKEIERVNDDPDFHEYMSAEEDNRKIENSIRSSMIRKGLKEGLEKGIKQGISQGIKQGTQTGIEQEQQRIVYTMLDQGLDIKEIAKYTKISENSIEKYQKDRKENSKKEQI